MVVSSLYMKPATDRANKTHKHTHHIYTLTQSYREREREREREMVACLLLKLTLLLLFCCCFAIPLLFTVFRLSFRDQAGYRPTQRHYYNTSLACWSLSAQCVTDSGLRRLRGIISAVTEHVRSDRVITKPTDRANKTERTKHTDTRTSYTVTHTGGGGGGGGGGRVSCHNLLILTHEGVSLFNKIPTF